MASRLAQAMGQGVANFGYGGGNPAMQFQLLRAAGYRPEQGMQGWGDAMLRLQDPQTNIEAGFEVVRQMGRAGGVPSSVAIMNAQRAYQEITGQRLHQDTIAGIMSDPSYDLPTVPGAARSAGAGVPGVLSVEAGLENERIEVGYAAAYAVQTLNASMIELAQAGVLLMPVINGIADAILALTEVGVSVTTTIVDFIKDWQENGLWSALTGGGGGGGNNPSSSDVTPQLSHRTQGG